MLWWPPRTPHPAMDRAVALRRILGADNPRLRRLRPVGTPFFRPFARLDEAMAAYEAAPDSWMVFALARGPNARAGPVRSYCLAWRGRATLARLADIVARGATELHEVVGPRTRGSASSAHPRKVVVDVDYHGCDPDDAARAFDRDIDAVVAAVGHLWGPDAASTALVLAGTTPETRGRDGSGFHVVLPRVVARGVDAMNAALRAIADACGAETTDKVDLAFAPKKTVRAPLVAKGGKPDTALRPYRCGIARLPYISDTDVLRLGLAAWFDCDISRLDRATEVVPGASGSAGEWRKRFFRAAKRGSGGFGKGSGDTVVDAHVRSVVHATRSADAHVYSVTTARNGRLLVFSIGGDRFCENVQRAHTSNHTKLVVDRRASCWWWECYGCDGWKSAKKLIGVL